MNYIMLLLEGSEISIYFRRSSLIKNWSQLKLLYLSLNSSAKKAVNHYYYRGLSKCPIILLFLVRIQHGHFWSIHSLDWSCLQIEHLQEGLDGAEYLLSLVGPKICSLDLIPPYNQYANNDIPIVMRIRLNMTERNISNMTPKARIVIANTRVQGWGVDPDGLFMRMNIS